MELEIYHVFFANFSQGLSDKVFFKVDDFSVYESTRLFVYK